MRIAWLYDKEYKRHPFICLALQSLRDHGHSAAILDVQTVPDGPCAEYVSIGESAIEADPGSAATTCARGFIRGAWRVFNHRWVRRLPGAGWVRKLLWFLWAAAETVRLKPDTIMATAVPATLMAMIARPFLPARMVYYSFELYSQQTNKLEWYWRRCEEYFVRHCIDALITQNEERARFYVEELGARVSPDIVHNYKARKTVPANGRLRQHLGLDQHTRIVLYEGILHSGRWLENLVLASQHLGQDVKVVFMGERSEWWKRVVEPLLSRPEISGRVLVAPWVPHENLLEFVSDADVGVIIYDDSNRNNYFCEPGKLSDYVIAGLPVIAPNFPTIGPVIMRHGIGAVFDGGEPRQIADALNAVLRQPKADWKPSIERARTQLVWETQYSALEQAVRGR